MVVPVTAPMRFSVSTRGTRASSSIAARKNSAQKIFKRSPVPTTNGAKWKGKYEDIKGFCNSANVKRVKELDYFLTPGRYVRLADDEDDFDFNERFTSLKTEFEAQLKEEAKLNKAILENLKKVKLV